ncbi:hypothetical protein [Streptomyces sp. H27-D2]|uniref:hypothetical protein n=1 Tax=Streptomyces sp. H27-D2 TaxID=3046304 RepID=UPI002DB84FE2|nr:hypothetical protein [Streptomyces sp. H27-D2]MEC4015691.1 hypothetical protein [Streptomyces sp. H27-D2]
MAITDDLRKTLSDATPLYAVAGTADLAAEKLKEVPALIEKIRAEAPERIAAVRATDPKVVQERVTQQAREAQSRINGALGSIDTDIKKLRDSAQDLALQGVGRAAEYAVKARETYDELAERGRGAVDSWRGAAAEQVEEVAVAIEPDPQPAAEKSTTEESTTASGSASTTDSSSDAAAADQSAASSSQPTAKKTAAQPAAAKKTTGGTPAPKKATPKSEG